MLRCSGGIVWHPEELRVSQRIVCLEPWSLLYCRLCLWFVCCPWWFMGGLGASTRNEQIDVFKAVVEGSDTVKLA